MLAKRPGRSRRRDAPRPLLLQGTAQRSETLRHRRQHDPKTTICDPCCARLGIKQCPPRKTNGRVRLIINRAYGFHSACAALALIIVTLGPIERPSTQANPGLLPPTGASSTRGDHGTPRRAEGEAPLGMHPANHEPGAEAEDNFGEFYFAINGSFGDVLVVRDGPVASG